MMWKEDKGIQVKRVNFLKNVKIRKVWDSECKNSKFNKSNK